MSFGRLITFEGVEGSGKSTVIAAAADLLQRRGLTVLQTREPGATDLGRQIRQLLLHTLEEVADRAELFLYLADRADHIASVLEPAVAAGTIVLCDRFTDSTIAYQGYGRQLPLQPVIDACAMAQTMVVDRTYLLDLDPAIGLERALSRGEGKDRLEREKLAFHQRIRAGYLELAAQDPDRVVVIDAAQTAEAVAAAVCRDLEKLLDAGAQID